MTVMRIRRLDDGGLCTLTLDRPGKLNALDTQAFVELDTHLADLERQTGSVGCVVLRGEGRAFCAGADLKALGVHSDGSPVDPAFKPGVIARLGALPQPVIAAIHGVCFAGGLELALACNFIVADESARFADTHSKWGLVAAWGLFQRLPRRVGMPRAQEMMMTGREIDAREAHAIGLADRLAATGEADAEARAMAAAILANSWHVNFAVKRSCLDTDGMPLAQALEQDRRNDPGKAPDHAERLERFARR